MRFLTINCMRTAAVAILRLRIIITFKCSNALNSRMGQNNNFGHFALKQAETFLQKLLYTF